MKLYCFPAKYFAQFYPHIEQKFYRLHILQLAKYKENNAVKSTDYYPFNTFCQAIIGFQNFFAIFS